MSVYNRLTSAARPSVTRKTPSLYLPTLIVDSNAPAAAALATELGNNGLSADIAVNFATAREAIRTTHFRTIVLAADLGRNTDVECLATLRRSAPRTWIIVISLRFLPGTEGVAFRYGADSLLTMPFDVAKLAFRLSAFSLRGRPP